MGKKKAIGQAHHEPSIERRVLIAYYATLAALFVSSFFPQARLWGINWWAYYPLWGRLTILAAGALAPLPLMRWNPYNRDISNRTYKILATGILVGSCLIFYLLRAKTYFLGDGYTLISELGSDQPFIKPRNIGGMGLQYLLVNLIGDKTHAAVTLACNLTAIVSGLIFVGMIIVMTRRMLATGLDRLLMLSATATGGYALMFFGYIENYALFIVALAAFTFVGIKIANHQLNKIWILLFWGLCFAIHIFGATLLIPVLYLLTAQSRVGANLARLSFGTKVLLITSVILITAIALAVVTAYSPFVRFALVPLTATASSIPGYTLLSLSHLLDLANLAFILFPGMCVVLVSIQMNRLRSATRLVSYRFLFILALTCVAVTAIFDPTLGMSRDWDLFSFSGVPLIIGATYLLLSGDLKSSPARLAVTLSVVLGLVGLFSRAIVLAVPNMGVQQFRSYVELDRARNRAGSSYLTNYYLSIGDTAAANSFDTFRQNLYVEERLVRTAKVCYEKRDFVQMRGLLRQAIATSPRYGEAWLGLARYFVATGQCDSGIYAAQIADGLNPYSSATMLTLGNAYLCKGDLNRAEAALKQSVGIDSSSYMPLHQLAIVYQRKNDERRYLEFMTRAVTRPQIQVSGVRELIGFFIRGNDFTSASKWLSYGLTRGLDSTYADSIAVRHPQIRLR